MAQPVPTKPGNVALTRIGHTYDNRFGMTPMAQEKGKQSPTEAVFGK